MSLSGKIVRTGSHEKGIVCHEMFYAAGARLATHAHELPFFALTLDGSFGETVNGTTIEYEPLGVVYHGAGEEHSVAVGDRYVRCFVIELNHHEIERRYSLRLPRSMLRAGDGTLASLLTAAYRELRYADSCSWIAIEAVALQLLVSAARVADEGRPTWLRRVEELLRERFRSPLTLADIAGEVGVSAPRISTEFRRVFRRSLAEEQRRLRIEFACRRLLNGDGSLAEIALESGFSDQPHFTRTFKAVTGMTPAQYRVALTTSGASS